MCQLINTCQLGCYLEQIYHEAQLIFRNIRASIHCNNGISGIEKQQRWDIPKTVISKDIKNKPFPLFKLLLLVQTGATLQYVFRSDTGQASFYDYLDVKSRLQEHLSQSWPV